MKIWKLVAGILSIIFSVIVFFQSMLVGTANTLSSNGEVGGSAGLFVSVFMLCIFAFLVCTLILETKKETN